jgi:hypothetical protein
MRYWLQAQLLNETAFPSYEHTRVRARTLVWRMDVGSLSRGQTNLRDIWAYTERRV